MSSGLELTADERKLILEALESHAYWQVSDERYRNNGYVYAPGSDDAEAASELRAIDALSVKLGGEEITGS